MNTKSFILLPSMVVSLFLLSGCASYCTTLMDRLPGNQLTTNWCYPKERGIPMKIKVPSHVEVTVYETSYMVDRRPKAGGSSAAPAAAAAAPASNGPNPVPTPPGMGNNISIKTSASARAASEEFDDTADNSSCRVAGATTRRLDRACQTELEEEAHNFVHLTSHLVDSPCDKSQCQNFPPCANSTAPFCGVDGCFLPASNACLEISKRPIKCVKLPKPVRRIETKLCYKDKVMMIDFIRPAAGTLAVGGPGTAQNSIDSEGYFQTIQSSIIDNTIRDINAAITGIATGTPPKPLVLTAGDLTTISGIGGIRSFDSVIAVQKFDVSEPNWELRLNEFVAPFLQGQCPPGVECPQGVFECPPGVPGSTPTDASNSHFNDGHSETEIPPGPQTRNDTKSNESMFRRVNNVLTRKIAAPKT